MERVTLVRLESSDQGTFGKIIFPGLTLFTGELPWIGNQANVSCIPAGLYKCLWTRSPRFQKHLYLIDHVVNRSGVRIHSANLMGNPALGFRSQLNGCISLGEKIGWMSGQKAVLMSAPAVRKFTSLMEQKPFLLEVKHVD